VLLVSHERDRTNLKLRRAIMGGEENGTGAYPVHGLVHSFDIEGNAKGAGKGILRMTNR
jgi:hypothetical protein